MARKKETRGRKKVLTKRQRAKNDQISRENWRKAHTKIINVRFHIETDEAVLKKLDEVENKTDYIRTLILDDISREK